VRSNQNNVRTGLISDFLIPYPSLRAAKKEERREKKESEENLHVVR
jgi:hypothetical protein